jgi:hypothetical protein
MSHVGKRLREDPIEVAHSSGVPRGQDQVPGCLQITGGVDRDVLTDIVSRRAENLCLRFDHRVLATGVPISVVDLKDLHDVEAGVNSLLDADPRFLESEARTTASAIASPRKMVRTGSSNQL